MGIIDDMEVDVLAFNEHKINFAHKDNRRHGLAKLFNGGETLTRAVGGNLKHPIAKSLGKRMEGGTGIVAYGELASLLNQDLSGMDTTGLARWSYMTFTGREGYVTTIIVGYNPCRTTSSQQSTSYQLQRSYFTLVRKDTLCPRRHFREDLLNLLVKWREEGRRLIVCLDANDHVYTGPLGRAMISHPNLDLREATLTSTGSPLTATHFRGSKPIDAIWTTPDVEIANICAMPIGYGVGDHRSFILDISTRSIVGLHPQPVKRPSARRLNTKIPNCSDTYISILENQLLQHKIIPKLDTLRRHPLPNTQLQATLDSIDQTVSQLMLHAEKSCRKLRSGRIPFSPEASLWIKRTLCYRSLLRYWAGKIRNKGNLKRQALRCRIDNPFSLSIQTLADRLTECKQRCKHFARYGHRHRRAHLTHRLHAARDNQDENAERRILQIIKGEKERAFWRRLNWALGKHRGCSVRAIQVENQDGSISEYNTQSEVQHMIWDKIHRERYHLAEEAPICQGYLRGEFGYNANTPAGDAVLNGTYSPPMDTHAGTQLLFKAIGHLRQCIPPNSVTQIITRQDWQYTWKHKQESTSSSQSGLHFGHYVSGADSDMISDVHALKTSIALHNGIALTRWKSGLCVMIEKSPGVKLISKLRAILLMEADFNAANKIIFGQRMMTNVRRYHLMPDEIFSEKQRMAEDGILSKTLFYDISRQLKAPAALASVDAANCYDRVAHAVASLVFRAMGAQLPMTLSMLTAIQQMQFYLRTAFGDSDNAIGSRIHLKTQGFMQGNGASPAGWTVVSIAILQAHKSEGHGASFLCPVSEKRKDLACILYVDDTDLLHICQDQVDTVYDAHTALQDSITSWGNLLIATGGALKPQKCFFYLIDYVWDSTGKWKYSPPSTTEALCISVPQPDGSHAEIKQLSTMSASTTLGGTLAPSNLNCQLEAMSDKALTWANQAKTSGLRPRDFHISVERKFWPKVKYGLCSNTAPLQDLISAMHRPYYRMAPIGGLIRSARREIRFLDTGFYGLGFPHWGIEALIEAYRKFYTHYGTTTVVGTQLQMSIELLICEVGMSSQPFILDYSRFGNLATDGFCKRLWEKVNHFHFLLLLDNNLFPLPREQDRWIMKAFEDIGYSLEERSVLNTVRLHQHVLFESDVFEADGRSINAQYLLPRPLGSKWSKYRFGTQKPPPSAFSLWVDALSQLAPGGRRNPKLGKFIHPPHTSCWNRYDEQEGVVLQQSHPGWKIFRRQDVSRRARTAPYTSDGITNAIPTGLPLCSTKESQEAGLILLSHTPSPPPPTVHTHFHDLLLSWSGAQWWNELKYSEDGTWLYHAARQGTLICVSDGSFIRELHPDVCSAAIIIECSNSLKRLSLSIIDISPSANAFRGELLGLLAIHLILHSIHATSSELSGSAQIHSDCTGALRTVSSLPPSGIPPKWRHADILKVLSLYGNIPGMTLSYHHVKAHQDDGMQWHQLSRVSQLNCACDLEAKRRIFEHIPAQHRQYRLPQEPISMIVDHIKCTSDSDSVIRLNAHKQEAKKLFYQAEILNPAQFDEIAWEDIHHTLHSLPKMFQLFAGKQVFGVSAVLGNLSKQKEFSSLGNKCPSCTTCKETTQHVLLCREIGRVKCVNLMINRISEWMFSVRTVPALADLITTFLHTRGDVPQNYQLPYQYHSLSQSLQKIGWLHMMEGMVSKELLLLDRDDVLDPHSKMSHSTWIRSLIRKLLEATHGIWIYRNLAIHHDTSGLLATQGKEHLIQEIENQIERGGDGLAEQDKWMLEIDLDRLNISSGERESYWLLAIQTARSHFTLQNEAADTP